jgi:hypothetical protein
LDFVRIELDDVSQLLFSENLTNIESPVSKSLIIKYFEEKVADGKMEAKYFIYMALSLLDGDHQGLESVINYLLSMTSKIVYCCSVYEAQQQMSQQIFLAIMKLYIRNEEEIGYCNMLKPWMVQFGTNNECLIALVNMWQGLTPEFEGSEIEFQTETCWNIINQVVGSDSFTMDFKLKLFEKYKDQGDTD